MSTDRAETAARLRELLETEGDSVKANTAVFNRGRYDSVAELDDYEELKDRAREIKEDAIERLPELIDELTESVEENGGHVYLASDAAAANRYIEEVCSEAGAETLVKSKSMTSEEIEVNDHLEQAGIDVTETDLAEFVLQIANEEPSHIVAPAIHKSREEIARLIETVFDPDDPPETAEELTMFAREHLLEKVKAADVGMTGANFLVAESGTMMLVTSEGNARKSAVAPDTHVALAGVEKIVPRFEDLAPFVELIGRSGTGQDLTSYVSLLTPPVESPAVDFDSPDVPGFGGSDAEREFHLVLLDNGRMAMREDSDLQETLYCIRCAACSNTCANFQHVGGHAFGGETYSGGIATGWEAGVHGLDSAAEFNDLCTGCSRCVPACPVKIDIPWINEVVRDRINHGTGGEFDFLVDGLVPDAEEGGPDLQKRLFGNYGTLARLGSATAPVSNWVGSLPPARLAMERLFGVDRRRPLPEFQRETLVDWFEGRGGPRVSAVDAEREAVFYADAYTNYVDVERGKATVRTLEALGVHVRVPAVPESGRAPLSQGMLATADEAASAVYGTLAEHVDSGRDIVVVEPSDLAMFRSDYEHLLPERSFDRLAENSYEVLEYVYGLLENGAGEERLRAGEDRVAYHSHCQQRTLGLEGYTEAVLERLGYDVLTSEVECCGMAGSFGYKRQYYDLAVDVGHDLVDQFERPGERDRVVLTSGTSCTDQLDDLMAREPIHPIELIAPE